jgi:hypothetical protein
VVRVIGTGEDVITGQIPFTSRAKKVLELALREALSLRNNYIGTEHLLLGLVRLNEGQASRILLDFGADSHEVRNRVVVAMRQQDKIEGDSSTKPSQRTWRELFGKSPAQSMPQIVDPVSYPIQPTHIDVSNTMPGVGIELADMMMSGFASLWIVRFCQSRVRHSNSWHSFTTEELLNYCVSCNQRIEYLLEGLGALCEQGSIVIKGEACMVTHTLVATCFQARPAGRVGVGYKLEQLPRK